MRITWVPLLVLLLLVACAPSTDPPVASTSPSASAEAGYAGCMPIDLRLQSGEELDLTGTWVGGSTIHYLRQVDDCVWWVGMSDQPGESPAGSWLNSFQGHLHPDFTLSGIWADVYTTFRGSLHEGRTNYVILVSYETDGSYEIVLEQGDEHGIPLRDYYANRLVRLESSEDE